MCLARAMRVGERTMSGLGEISVGRSCLEKIRSGLGRVAKVNSVLA